VQTECKSDEGKKDKKKESGGDSEEKNSTLSFPDETKNLIEEEDEAT
jgi:hypothetical protein